MAFIMSPAPAPYGCNVSQNIITQLPTICDGFGGYYNSSIVFCVLQNKTKTEDFLELYKENDPMAANGTAICVSQSVDHVASLNIPLFLMGIIVSVSLFIQVNLYV